MKTLIRPLRSILILSLVAFASARSTAGDRILLGDVPGLLELAKEGVRVNPVDVRGVDVTPVGAGLHPAQVIATHPHPDTQFEDTPLSAIGNGSALDIYWSKYSVGNNARSGAAKDAQTKLATTCEVLKGILLDNISNRFSCAANWIGMSCTTYTTATCRIQIQKEVRAG